MKSVEISYKDLTNSQLIALKEIYIKSRLDKMSESDLRKFTRDVLELQILSTVGNQEEREAWKEMKDYFQEEFEKQIKTIVQAGKGKEESLTPEQEEFQKRLEALEKRKTDQNSKEEDMW